MLTLVQILQLSSLMGMPWSGARSSTVTAPQRHEPRDGETEGATSEADDLGWSLSTVSTHLPETSETSKNSHERKWVDTAQRPHVDKRLVLEGSVPVDALDGGPADRAELMAVSSRTCTC